MIKNDQGTLQRLVALRFIKKITNRIGGKSTVQKSSNIEGTLIYVGS